MQTPEQMALSFTGECERASLGLCANHKAPLGDATTCLHVLHLSELIRARDVEVRAEVKRLRAIEAGVKALAEWWQRIPGDGGYEAARKDHARQALALLNPTEGDDHE